MLTLKELPTLMLTKYPEYLIETCFENKIRFVCSLRHKSMPRGAATGSVCYFVDKKTQTVTPYSIVDPKVNFEKDDIIRI